MRVQGKNPMEKLEGTVLRDHTGLEIAPISKSQSRKPHNLQGIDWNSKNVLPHLGEVLTLFLIPANNT